MIPVSWGKKRDGHLPLVFLGDRNDFFLPHLERKEKKNGHPWKD
jgi:hypothetical protein